MKNNIKKLIKSDVSRYKIHKETGVAQSTLSDLTKGKAKIGNMKLDTAIKLNNYHNNIKGDMTMNEYINTYTIKMNITDDLKEELQRNVYRIRNTNLDHAQEVYVDAVDIMACEVDEAISEGLYSLDEIESVEYTRINKDTNMNEIVQLDVEVEELEEDEVYKVFAKSVKAWNESI